jgi:16S rRNA (uracil1498-N3)-methyltransferase
MHRFFVSPDCLEGNRISISGSLAHQIRNVLRLRVGDRIVVLDDSGWERVITLVRVGQEQTLGRVVSKNLSTGEPQVKVSLYQSVLKGSRFEIALQKGTELGVIEFVPLIARRCVVSDLDNVDKKQERWQRIVLEAAEQSRRGRLPRVRAAVLFPQACERARQLSTLSLIPTRVESRGESANIYSLRDVLRGEGREQGVGSGAEPPPSNLGSNDSSRHYEENRVSIFIGPEGGFTPDEVSLAQSHGLIPVTLGPRILRAETAGLVVATALLYEWGELEG